MNIVILGCGRVGARLACALHAAHEVTVVDWDPSAFDRLGEEFAGRTHLGNGIDVDCLKAIDVGSADLFIALTSGDNRNLMASQVAQRLGARRAIVRVYDAERAEIFARMGVHTISPTIVGADRLFRMAVGNKEA